MMNNAITEYITEVETTKEYNGYFCSVAEVITIVILESMQEWQYYISSRRLTAEELLHHARMEWTVETMHWLLDVHFGEEEI